MEELTPKDVEKIIAIIRVAGEEFSDVPDEKLEGWMELVKPMVSKKQFGKLFPNAMAYLICHRLKMAGYGSDEGIGGIASALRLASASEGETSVSFANNGITSDVDAEYALTIYGRQFLTIRRIAIIPIHSSGEPVAGMEDS